MKKLREILSQIDYQGIVLTQIIGLPICTLLGQIPHVRFANIWAAYTVSFYLLIVIAIIHELFKPKKP